MEAKVAIQIGQASLSSPTTTPMPPPQPSKKKEEIALEKTAKIEKVESDKSAENKLSSPSPPPAAQPSPIRVEDKPMDKEVPTKSVIVEKKQATKTEILDTDKPYEDNRDYAIWMPPKGKKHNLYTVYIFILYYIGRIVVGRMNKNII